MSVQSDKITSALSRAIQDVVGRGLHDPRVRGLISVTRIEMSPDRRNATVFVSVLPAEHAKLTLHGLRHGAQHIRSGVARKVRMRRVPQLAFTLDESIKNEARVIAAINAARADDAALLGKESIEGKSEGTEP